MAGKWRILIVLVCTMFLLAGCKKYPPVSSRESLELMKLLYSACNTRDTERLDRVEKGVNDLSVEGKMTAEEKKTFDQIIGWARAGKWEKAEDAAYQFAKDQVGAVSPTRATTKEKHSHSHNH